MEHNQLTVVDLIIQLYSHQMSYFMLSNKIPDSVNQALALPLTSSIALNLSVLLASVLLCIKWKIELSRRAKACPLRLVVSVRSSQLSRRLRPCPNTYVSNSMICLFIGKDSQHSQAGRHRKHFQLQRSVRLSLLITNS